jgi:putative transposase
MGTGAERRQGGPSVDALSVFCYASGVAKQTFLVKLDPSPEQAERLRETLEAFNAACNWLAGIAFASGSANKFKLQKAAYQETRERFGLSSQTAVRAISKVCEAFKRDGMKRPEFRPHGAMIYDERIMAWKGLARVSLLTLSGRVLVPIRFSAYQAARLDRRHGQADLILRDGKWFLAVTIDAPEGEPIDPEGVLGVDLGIVNVATDSDGNQYSGGPILGLRRSHRRTRTRLQSRGTKSAKRLLKKRRRRESRFQRHENHRISKELVARAKDTKRAIALEELTHIRARIRSRKPQRATFSSWAFAQLRTFIEYKAQQAGVPVFRIDPRNTSRTCPTCGHCEKANRKSQAEFLCVSCGCAGNADSIAAENIRRAALSLPDAVASGLTAKSLPFRGGVA